MKRINVMVEDPAREVLGEWKKQHGFSTLDEALNDLLLKVGVTEMARRKEAANHVDDLTV